MSFSRNLKTSFQEIEANIQEMKSKEGKEGAMTLDQKTGLFARIRLYKTARDKELENQPQLRNIAAAQDEVLIPAYREIGREINVTEERLNQLKPITVKQPEEEEVEQPVEEVQQPVEKEKQKVGGRRNRKTRRRGKRRKRKSRRKFRKKRTKRRRGRKKSRRRRTRRR